MDSCRVNVCRGLRSDLRKPSPCFEATPAICQWKIVRVCFVCFLFLFLFLSDCRAKAVGSPGAKADGSDGAKADGSNGAKADGSDGAKADGSRGAKADGSLGAKADGSLGAKADGCERAKAARSDRAIEQPSPRSSRGRAFSLNLNLKCFIVLFSLRSSKGTAPCFSSANQPPGPR
jgi:hypothetical protein